jgi:hypothetical protein
VKRFGREIITMVWPCKNKNKDTKKAKGKGKVIPVQAVEALRVARG